MDWVKTTMGSIRRLSPITKDVLFAAALTGLTQIELLLAEEVEGSWFVQAPAFAAITASVGWRRGVPLFAAGLASAGLLVQTLFGGVAPVAGGFIAFLVVTYSVARHAEKRMAIAGAALIAIGILAFPIADPEDRNLPDFVGNFAIFGLVWGLGRVVRSRQHQADALEAHAEALERDRERQLRAMIAEERARIARELHDIVAHSVSVMVLQSGAARQVLDKDPQRAREPLIAAEETGRQALDEMHRLLGILRRDEEGLALAPPATIEQLHALMEQVRGAGLAVELNIAGRQRPLPPSMELSAYRIVQEALTNTLKHAGASRAEVLVRYGDRELELIVTDDGGSKDSVPGRHGHGLVGMRERVAMFDGTLEAGRRDGRGWVVHASFPLEGHRS